MVGSAIHRLLVKLGYENIIVRTSSELDLRDQQAVDTFFEKVKPKYVFVAAAKVGGIHANNTYRAEFLYDNLMIASNVIHSAYVHQSEKLLFLGSSCIYPKFAEQPMNENALLTGTLEPTNEPYAIAKIAGIKMCETYRDQYGCNFISAMPTNLYGIGDNYNLNTSHVLPALIRKFHEAKEAGADSVEVWGSGTPKREFMYADDLAEACLHLMLNYDGKQFVNVGTGAEVTIKELAETIQKTVGFKGHIDWNTEMPDGTPRKLMDVSKMSRLGWKPTVHLSEGVQLTFNDFLVRKDQLND